LHCVALRTALSGNSNYQRKVDLETARDQRS